MRNFIDAVSVLCEGLSVGQTILITDLYDASELSDESEKLGHSCPPVYWDDPLTVREMSVEEAKANIMSTETLTLWASFERDASKRQQAIVKRKMKSFDPNRIVVLDGDEIIDGNHHVIAAIMTGNPVRYVDLGEWE